MFILADALQRTGAAQGVVTMVERAARRGQRVLMLTLLPVVMVLSGFMNNTGVVVLLLPLLIAAGRRSDVSPSRLLLPLSYASITGGTLTLVGTTTTLLVDGMIRQAGYPGLTFFQILPVGLAFCAVALVYLTFAGPRLLPDRTGHVVPEDSAPSREYVTEIVLAERSRLVGRRLGDFPGFGAKVGVLELVRGEETHWPPSEDTVLEAGDLLVVKGTPEEIVPLLQRRDVEGPSDGKAGGEVKGVTLDLAEVMIAPHSRLDHQTVTEARIRDRFGVFVLAVMRVGAHVREKLGSLRLRVGDVLLVQGEAADVARLARNEHDIVVLGGAALPERRPHKAPLAIGVVATALALSAVGLVPLPIAVLLAAVTLVVGGCLSSSQAYRSIDLRILVILGSMLGLGFAARETGIAANVADVVVTLGERLGPQGILAMIYITTAILTELVTNAGTAAIMIPIALSTADKAGVSHVPFVIAVALAASCSFLTPVGYQTNLLVYGPGGYRLQDYLKLGAPLAVLLWLLATFLVPLVYPF
jgi:di/tricarboxylate transporter